MFNFEMSYINTNHDDFIGFTQAAANTANEVKKTQTKVENKVIRSGWLSLGNVGMMRGKFKKLIRYQAFKGIVLKESFQGVLVSIYYSYSTKLMIVY